MLAAWLFPRARRVGDSDQDQHHPPGIFDRSLTPILLSFSKRACVHPIYTIISVAILASTTYLGLFESSLFDRRITANNAIGRIDLNYLLAGSKQLYAGPETQWKWITPDSIKDNSHDVSCQLPQGCHNKLICLLRMSLSSLWSFQTRPLDLIDRLHNLHLS
jgi:hydroxymethylglutaryl-CoA reductase (NADPH)